VPFDITSSSVGRAFALPTLARLRATLSYGHHLLDTLPEPKARGQEQESYLPERLAHFYQENVPHFLLNSIET